ncbi:hypothetical protein DVH24_017066 [Malus domestica]|uniref:Gnk2-homologous domain-containing protein n=1 Tax=Malus domestica TaxID=3750 RepID=A0A498IX27_MALDO|nr:hypothetical protein DVH24_017066 [Malus domestica]
MHLIVKTHRRNKYMQSDFVEEIYLNNSRYDLPQRCPNQKEAIGWYDKCMLGHSNRSIYGVMETSPSFYLHNRDNVSRLGLYGFNQELRKLLDSIRSEAAAGGSLRKFAFRNTSSPTFQTIFAHVYRFIDPTTVKQLPSPPPIPSPISSHPPSTNTTNTSQGSKSNKSRTVIIIVLPFVASLTLVIFICVCVRVRRTKQMLQSNLHPGEDADEIGSAESLQFNFDTIRVATDDFSEANKLGQGGFGSVYKIVSGQKNNCFRHGDNVEDLLSYTWKCWREGTAPNLIDPTLTNGSRNEIMRCIHIGLLCVQEI